MSANMTSNSAWAEIGGRGPAILQPAQQQMGVQRHHLKSAIDRVGHLEFGEERRLARLGDDGVIEPPGDRRGRIGPEQPPDEVPAFGRSDHVDSPRPPVPRSGRPGPSVRLSDDGICDIRHWKVYDNARDRPPPRGSAANSRRGPADEPDDRLLGDHRSARQRPRSRRRAGASSPASTTRPRSSSCSARPRPPARSTTRSGTTSASGPRRSPSSIRRCSTRRCSRSSSTTAAWSRT